VEYFLHDPNFTEAFANTEHTVFGKRLAPFCLWHQFALELVQSKALAGVPLTTFDLWVAVRVCTTPWTPWHRVPDLRPPSKLRFLWEVGRYDFSVEVKKFSAYLADYTTQPKLWPNNHNTEVQGADDRDMDDHFETVMHLITSTNVTLEQAWTMPVGMARWMSIASLKLSGAKIDIWTPEHQARFEVHVKEREAKIDAHGKEISDAAGIPYEAARKKAHDEYWAKVHDQNALAALKSKHGKR